MEINILVELIFRGDGIGQIYLNLNSSVIFYLQWPIPYHTENCRLLSEDDDQLLNVGQPGAPASSMLYEKLRVSDTGDDPSGEYVAVCINTTSFSGPPQKIW